MNAEFAVFLMALVISIILAIIKVTIWAGLTWFWVFVPLMLALGVIFVCSCDGDMW